MSEELRCVLDEGNMILSFKDKHDSDARKNNKNLRHSPKMSEVPIFGQLGEKLSVNLGKSASFPKISDKPELFLAWKSSDNLGRNYRSTWGIPSVHKDRTIGQLGAWCRSSWGKLGKILGQLGEKLSVNLGRNLKSNVSDGFIHAS